MTVLTSQAPLDLEPETFKTAFDREPFGFTHNLSELELFAPDSLVGLAKKYDGHPRDFYIAAGAPSPGAEFYSVPHRHDIPSAALDHLEPGGAMPAIA